MGKIWETERNGNFSSVIIILYTDLLEKSRINHISGWMHFTITGRIAKEKMARRYADNGYQKNHLVVKIGIGFVCSLLLMTLVL